MRTRGVLERAGWLGLAAAVALAAAGGAWALGQHRYGEMLNEWRWRGQLRGVKSVRAAPPEEPGIRLATLLDRTPEREIGEGGRRLWLRSCSGCSARPSP